jgi:hypothetical protein
MFIGRHIAVVCDPGQRRQAAKALTRGTLYLWKYVNILLFGGPDPDIVDDICNPFFFTNELLLYRLAGQITIRRLLPFIS